MGKKRGRPPTKTAAGTVAASKKKLEAKTTAIPQVSSADDEGSDNGDSAEDGTVDTQASPAIKNEEETDETD